MSNGNSWKRGANGNMRAHSQGLGQGARPSGLGPAFHAPDRDSRAPSVWCTNMRKLKGVLTILPVRKFASAETVTWLGVSELDPDVPVSSNSHLASQGKSGSDHETCTEPWSDSWSVALGFHGVRTQPPSTS